MKENLKCETRELAQKFKMNSQQQHRDPIRDIFFQSDPLDQWELS